jgi:hypothetical protein
MRAAAFRNFFCNRQVLDFYTPDLRMTVPHAECGRLDGY